ncbi:hypothetical protein CAPTEDRAFT_199348 [Capitella teleta]|uniref:Sulfotransferase domain-containing protein n=1 Tax=Capitella teleta TaxID=283909 RepID=R7TUE3_CAPTE|nr:hypothetical protein CAPTEDRAFT_199348 [Capitella teleta]|eukprot:ELT97289.1 hypothetical protein CAPTEDRAFT_199348 [Capitella teleta]
MDGKKVHNFFLPIIGHNKMIDGVFTGSIYKDPDLRIPFPGEGKHGSSVSAIKTHWPLFAQEQDLLDYARIILVVRDPEDAIRSSYVFHKSGENHTGLLNENWEVKDWSTYLDSCLQEWESFHEFWINHALSHRLPLLVLNYAAMKTDINSTVYKMAAFLDAPLSEERARCVLANQEGGFHRVKHGRVEEILPSTETQRQESMRMAARMRTIIGKCLSERHCDTNEHSMTLPSQ